MGRVLTPNAPRTPPHIVQGQLYIIRMRTNTFHLMADAWFEYVRGSYIPLLSSCLNDLVDRNGLTVSFLTCWETFTFSMNYSPDENWLWQHGGAHGLQRKTCKSCDFWIPPTGTIRTGKPEWKQYPGILFVYSLNNQANDFHAAS